MAGLNTAQIKDRARSKGISLSESQAQSILSQAWDQNQYGADAGAVDSMLSGMSSSSRSSSRPSTADIQRELENQLSDALIELEDKLSGLQVGITQEEMDQFLQKAITQVTPYYKEKFENIQKGIEEGKIRNSEDLLVQMRQVRDEIDSQLAGYDIDQAETEEELADTLAQITAREEEDLEFKRDDWRRRIEQSKTQQVQQGTLTSGVGRKYIQDLLSRQQMEEEAIQRRADVSETNVKRDAKYDLERIALARQKAEQSRIRRLGTPEQMRDTVAQAGERIGVDTLDDLASESEIQRRRDERNQTVYRPEDLKAAEEQKKRAIESRRQELIADERATRQKEYEAKRRSAINELAEKNRNIASRLYQYM